MLERTSSLTRVRGSSSIRLRSSKSNAVARCSSSSDVLSALAIRFTFRLWHFVADAPNRLWVADATYVPTAEGFLYLAVV
jgi:transposase InsO family protein